MQTDGRYFIHLAADFLKDVLKWCESQFKEMGKGDRSETLALNLLAGLQGVSLLTLTFKDPKVIEQQSNFLIKWIRKRLTFNVKGLMFKVQNSLSVNSSV